MFYQPLAPSSKDKKISSSGLGIGLCTGVDIKSIHEEYQRFSHAAFWHPLLELKTISIVQFDCLNQTDLQQIHLSFDKSITVSFHWFH